MAGHEVPQGELRLTGTGRVLVLVTAFLGWLCGGLLLQTTTLAMRSAAIDLLGRVEVIDLPRFAEMNKQVQERKADPENVASLSDEDAAQLDVWRAAAQEWFAYYQCVMLFGAATGGLAFGWLGDRIGRASAMAASILCFSLLSAAAYFAQTPMQLLVLWFLACTGVGGMWPNGVALLSETWSDLSRPLVAGILGTSANVGIFALATVGTWVAVTPDHWRWMLLVCAAPVVLGLFVAVVVPESPRWWAARARHLKASDLPPAIATAQTTPVQLPVTTADVFRLQLLWITLVGILLATIPLFGAWGSANWMVPWAGEAGETANPPNPHLQAYVSQARSLTGIVGSLLGGWIGHILGRRLAYCGLSLAALFCAQWTFWLLVPTDTSFLYWVAALGFFSGVYFGWLPLFLPELFPTRVRSTGAGVCFNFGRILTAVTVFATGALTAWYPGGYARIGRVTSLVYLLGAAVVWLAPDTSRHQLKD
jgi:MFS family permease